MTLGERIKNFRKGRFSQAELADIVGVHENTLRRWELGERSPDADALMKLSKALGVSISELMEENDVEVIQKKMPSSTTKSSKGMLIYERDGERLELPPTEQGYNIMNNIAAAIASRTAKVAVL
ncbi:MAG: helix-turn-helix transcriptional regulator [Synergistaceae bacterium]|nr:helix-turn-helix transcriptional regulator [Synergistaceae bacterium]